MKQPVESALAQLREASARSEAPADLEARLLVAFRKQHKRAKRGFVWVPAAVSAAAAAALAILFWPHGPDAARPTSTLKSQASAAKVQVMELPKPAEEAPKPAEMPVRKRRAPSTPRRQFASRHTPAQEFIAIPYAPGLAEYDGGRVVRVNMPGASIRSLGLPVISDRVQADLFLGDDGIARAIRVIAGSSSNEGWAVTQGAEYQKVRTQ